MDALALQGDGNIGSVSRARKAEKERNGWDREASFFSFSYFFLSLASGASKPSFFSLLIGLLPCDEREVGALTVTGEVRVA